MKPKTVLIIFFAIILGFLTYHLMNLVIQIKHLNGIFDIVSIYNKVEDCNYNSLLKNIIFSEKNNSITFPDKSEYMKSCKFNYSYQPPFGGHVEFINCPETSFADSYKINWLKSFTMDGLKTFTLESDRWIIFLTETGGFTKGKPYLKWSFSFEKYLEYTELGKDYIWKECENDR